MAKSIFQSTLTLFFFLALMALGWGIDDLPGFFANPARVAVVVLLAAQAAFRVYRTFIPNRVPRHRLEHIGVYHLQLIALETVYVVAPFSDRRVLTMLPDSARWWGVALALAGMALASWALLTWPPRLVMVDTLNELSPEHALTGHPAAADRLRGDGADFLCGPFRWLRFPYYAGQILITAGLGLAFRAWAGVLIAVVLLVIVMVRTREMDQIYLRHFGAAWDGYMQKTKRLAPFIY